MFFRQRNVRREFPRLEFVGVNRFSGVVFGEALAEVVGRADVGLVRKILASEDVYVERKRPPSLA
jgi:hypothetical protein